MVGAVRQGDRQRFRSHSTPTCSVPTMSPTTRLSHRCRSGSMTGDPIDISNLGAVALVGRRAGRIRLADHRPEHQTRSCCRSKRSAADPLQTVEIITGRGSSADSHVVSLDPSHVDQTYGFRPTALIPAPVLHPGIQRSVHLAHRRVPPAPELHRGHLCGRGGRILQSARYERERASPTDTGTRSKPSGTTRSRPNGHSTRAC